jgi:hypothetical protein
MKSRPTTMRALGDWNAEIQVPLANALAVTVETTGKTGAEACARAMVMMAQSAKNLTPAANKNRPVLRETWGQNVEYVEVYRQGPGSDSAGFSKLHRFRFSPQAKDRLDGTWEKARRIMAAGLSKRSWFWGLRGLPGAPSIPGKPIRGVTTLFTINGTNTAGYELTDRIKFLAKILPAGWRAAVERAAVNRIMAVAKKKIGKDFQADMRRSSRNQARSAREAQAVVVDIGRFFKKVAA